MTKPQPTWAEIDEALHPQQRTAFGRPISEVDGYAADAFGRPRGPSSADFVEVGLSKAAAATAVEGLRAHRFISFEDAALSVAAMHERGPRTLDEAAMRRKARSFMKPVGD